MNHITSRRMRLIAGFAPQAAAANPDPESTPSQKCAGFPFASRFPVNDTHSCA